MTKLIIFTSVRINLLKKINLSWKFMTNINIKKKLKNHTVKVIDDRVLAYQSHEMIPFYPTLRICSLFLRKFIYYSCSLLISQDRFLIVMCYDSNFIKYSPISVLYTYRTFTIESRGVYTCFNWRFDLQMITPKPNTYWPLARCSFWLTNFRFPYSTRLII